MKWAAITVIGGTAGFILVGLYLLAFGDTAHLEFAQYVLQTLVIPVSAYLAGFLSEFAFRFTKSVTWNRQQKSDDKA